VLIDEMERMQRARTSRTFVKKRALQWRSLAVIMSQLFIRSTGRAEKIFAAMCSRGWQ
jgi:cobalt/nickel transport system permease protein